MKYTYRVVNFSNSPDEAPEPHTWVQVELSKIDGNEVCSVVGTTHVSLTSAIPSSMQKCARPSSSGCMSAA
jgi:hypothetical protein